MSEKGFVQHSNLRCTRKGKCPLQNRRMAKAGTRVPGSGQGRRTKQEPERGEGLGLRKPCEIWGL